MALHKHEPVPESMMKLTSPNYSICECLREIYWATDDEDIRYKCRVATAMAKAMGKKISELKGSENWYNTENFWDKKKNILED